MENAILNKKASEIMTSQLISLLPTDTLTHIEELMQSKKIHHIPVIDENGICKGIISQSDLYWLQARDTKFYKNQRAAKNKRFLAALQAQEIMTVEPYTVDKDTSVDQLIEIFTKNAFHAVVVTDQSKAVGIIASIDMIQLLRAARVSTMAA